MYKSLYGKIVKVNTITEKEQIIWIKELNPLMSWKTYKCELGVNYKKLLSLNTIVKFLVDRRIIGIDIVAVEPIGKDITIKDLMKNRP